MAITLLNPEYAPMTHSHDASDLTSGTLADARLPTKGSAGTAGTSAATSGASLAVPYITTDAYGRVTGKGTHTHTVTGFAASSHTHTESQVSIQENNVLWSGTLYMTKGHTATLSQRVSAQRHGIVLAWSAYANGAAQNYDWFYTYVPKGHIARHSGAGVLCNMSASTFGNIGAKYVYVNDANIVGNDNNNKTGSANGITYNNAHWVLREVYGV